MTIQIDGATFYDLEELSKKIGLSVTSIRAYIADGRLKGKKLGTRYYVSADEVKRYLSA